jgi:sec-independent protein translocase protein TatA
MSSLFAFLNFMPQGMEWVIILVVGIVIFGRKLPDVGRYLGKSIVEFKKGIKGIEDDVDISNLTRGAEPSVSEAPKAPQRVAASAPKFEDTPQA